MNVAVLGSGDIYYEFLNKIDAGGHKVVAVATNKGGSVDASRLKNLKHMPGIYSDYKEIVEGGGADRRTY